MTEFNLGNFDGPFDEDFEEVTATQLTDYLEHVSNTILISFLFIVAGLLNGIRYRTDLSTGIKRMFKPFQFLVFATPRFIIRKKMWDKKEIDSDEFSF